MPQERRERSSEADANRFLDLVSGNGFWRSVDLRVCAIRSGRNWVNLVTRGFLDHRLPRSVPSFCPVERQHFLAWQVVRPVADLPSIVHGIASGRAKLGPRPVRYLDQSSSAPTDIRYAFGELAALYRSAEYSWTCHALVAHGSSMWRLVQQAGHDPGELDDTIRGGPNAYDGLSDLVRRFCARLRRLDIRESTTVIELSAPMAVRFDRERVAPSTGCLTVALRAAADVFVADADLIWTIARASGEPVRHGSARLAESEWTREGGALLSKQDIPVRSGDTTATAFIVVGDRCVDHVTVPLASTASSIRIKAHDAIDPGLERFLKQLRPRGKDKSQQFEAAVGLLFFFLGFHVHPLSGHTRRGDTVDHLAHAPGSSVLLAIECTVGSLDAGGKVGKLIARRDDLRSRLPDTEVIAVLSTARLREALSKAEVEKAERDGVVLLAYEDIQDLWSAAQAGENSVQALQRFRRQLSLVRLRRTEGPPG